MGLAPVDREIRAPGTKCALGELHSCCINHLHRPRSGRRGSNLMPNRAKIHRADARGPSPRWGRKWTCRILASRCRLQRLARIRTVTHPHQPLRQDVRPEAAHELLAAQTQHWMPAYRLKRSGAGFAGMTNQSAFLSRFSTRPNSCSTHSTCSTRDRLLSPYSIIS